MRRLWLQIALSLPLGALLLAGEPARAMLADHGKPKPTSCASGHGCSRVAQDDDDPVNKLRDALNKGLSKPSYKESAPAKRQEERIRIKEQAIKRFDYQNQQLQLQEFDRRLNELNNK